MTLSVILLLKILIVVIIAVACYFIVDRAGTPQPINWIVKLILLIVFLGIILGMLGVVSYR